MKRIYLILGVVLFGFITPVNAQSQTERAKEYKSMKKQTESELNRKATKLARTEAKKLKKDGWLTAPGALPVEKQLDRSYRMQMEMDDDFLPVYMMGEERTSLVYEVAKLYSESKLIDNGKTDVSVNFRPTEFRIVPSDSIRYYKDLIKDHVVLFGAMNELADMHYTPLGEMAGVKLLAYSIQTLLEQTEVRHLPGWLTAIISFIIVLVTYLWRKGYMKWAKSNKSEWMRFFLTSTFVVGIVLFIWSAFLVWLTFLIFMTTDISINLGWAMAAIPFIGGAGEFYGLTLRRCFG